MRDDLPHLLRLDFVFDSYDLHLIKDCERKRRSTQNPIQLSKVLGDTPLPVDMNMFWGSSKNKLKVEILLHEVIAVSLRSAQQFVAGEIKHGKPCKSTINEVVLEMPELHSHMQEADERIPLHNANSLKYNINCVVVHSPDTDVIILLLYIFSILQANGLNNCGSDVVLVTQHCLFLFILWLYNMVHSVLCYLQCII